MRVSLWLVVYAVADSLAYDRTRHSLLVVVVVVGRLKVKLHSVEERR